MEFPVRCFTCGKVIAHLYEKYLEESKEKDKKEVLEGLGVRRYCCKRMFVSHVDILEHVLRYPRN